MDYLARAILWIVGTLLIIGSSAKFGGNFREGQGSRSADGLVKLYLTLGLCATLTGMFL